MNQQMNRQQLEAKEKADTVRGALQKMAPQLSMALPKHLTAERLLRVTMTAVQNTPRLLDCDRTSLFAAVMTCAQLGLEPDGVLGQAYLVPFNGKVQFIPGYKGYLTLARQSGEISSIQAHEVREHDHFDYAYGLNERLDHVPAKGNRGEIIYFYAYAKFKDGGQVFEVLSLEEVEEIRNASEGYKAFVAKRIKSTPWDSSFVQMGRKTAIRRLANYLPLSVQRAAALDSAYDAGKHGHADMFGDVVIEGTSEEVDDTSDPEESPVTSKMDAIAGNTSGATGKVTKQEAKPAPAKARAPAKAKPKPPEHSENGRYVIDEDDEGNVSVIDNSTGEIVPEQFIKWFDNGTYSVLSGYQGRAPAQQQTKPVQAEESSDEDLGLFGNE